MQLAAIIGLLLIVLAATLRPVNAGAIALVGTFVVGTFAADETVTTLYSGFPVDLFVLLFGVTYLFGIASVNGTIQWVVSRVAAILGAKAAFVPWAMFLVTAIATSAGAPGPAATAMMAPVWLGLAKRYDINPRLAGLMVVHGSCAGNFSPINPIGAIVNGTVARSGLRGDPIAVFAANFIYNVMLGLVIYVSFGGVDLLRRRGSQSVCTANVPDPFTEMNLVRLATLVCIVLAAAGALSFRLDLGMLAVSAAVMLHLLFPSTSEGAPSKIAWPTIIMICGVITYMALLQRTGAIKVVGDSVVSTPTLGVLLICFVAAITSVFAASPGVLGVVIPLSIPLLSSGAVSVTAVVIAPRHVRSFLAEPGRPLAELVDTLRRLRLGQPVVEFLARLSTQRFQVGALRVGHGLITRFPFVRLSLQCRLSGIVRWLFSHEANGTQNQGHSAAANGCCLEWSWHGTAPMSEGQATSPNAITARLTCLTYNIHSGIGLDKRYDLQRIRRVLADVQPHVAALQELECGVSRSSYDDQSTALSQGLALASRFCPVRPLEQGAFGIAVLSPFPVLHHEQYDLTYKPTREPRYCQRVDLSVAPGAVLHVFNCHLGLAARERAFQRNRMLSDAILLSEQLHHPVLLMGDFNDSPISVVHRSLRRHFDDAFSVAGKRWGPTFRAGPVPIRLDHIYCSRGIRVLDCWVRNDELTRVASDHRPVVASLEVTWPSALASTS